jgi:uncharacterized protein DUF5134
MGLAMVAMLWPLGRAVPTSAWLVVFAGSTGWFAAQASRAGRRWVAPVYFTSSAAAMVWMSTAMPAAPAMAMNMPGMDHPPAGRTAIWAPAAVGGYLVAAGLCWLLSGLRLGALRKTPDPPLGTLRAAPDPPHVPFPGASVLPPRAFPAAHESPLSKAPDDPGHCGSWRWPALCHGLMGVSMGLAVLTMI